MGLLAAALIVYFLREFSVIAQQLAFAGFLCYLITPIRGWLVRRGLPAFAAILVVLVGVLAASYGLGRALYVGLDGLISKLPDHQHHLISMVDKVARSMGGMASQRARTADAEGYSRSIAEKAEGLKQMIFAERWDVEHGLRVIHTGLGTFSGYLGQLTIVLIYLGVLLVEQVHLADRVAVAYGPRRGPPLMAAAYRFNIAIARYVLVKTMVGLLIGAATSLVLLLFDVDHAIFWGVVAFLAHFVPYLGGAVAMLLPTLLSLIQFENPLRAVLILVQLLVIQVLGVLGEPWLAGRPLRLSPLAVLLALALGWGVWGAVGIILAVPAAMVAKTILENIPETRPIAVILSSL